MVMVVSLFNLPELSNTFPLYFEQELLLFRVFGLGLTEGLLIGKGRRRRLDLGPEGKAKIRAEVQILVGQVPGA
jgi:hypothetical protein